MTTNGFLDDDERIEISDADASRPGDGEIVTDNGPAKLYSHADVQKAITNGAKMAADAARLPRGADRFTWGVAAVMAMLDAPGATWADVVRMAAAAGLAADNKPQFTADQVSQAVNAGVDRIADLLGRTCPDNLDNLVVNAALTLLDDPDADLDAVATVCYEESPDVVRSWL